MWVYDAETLRFVQINKGAVEHYGYSETDFLDMTLLDIRTEEGIEKIKEVFNNTNRHATGILKAILFIKKNLAN